MSDRLQRIGELLREELAERGDLDPGDVPTSWMTLVAVEHPNSPLGNVYRVAPSGQTFQTDLGLLHQQLLYVQGIALAVGAQNVFGWGESRDDPK